MNLDNIFSAAVGKYVPILTEYLPKCITLASISLRDNLLEEECLKILPILARIPTLTSLNLGGSNFTTLCSANKKHPTLKIIFAELARWMSSNNSVVFWIFRIISSCSLELGRTHLTRLSSWATFKCSTECPWCFSQIKKAGFM